MNRGHYKPVCYPVWLVAGLLGCLVAELPAGGADAHTDWSAWVDEEERLRRRIAEVNDGELSFLASPPPAAIHRHISHIRITEQSLIDGWVWLEQCHDHLDQVPAAQILFNPGRSRALEVVSYRNMDAAFADGNSIQLRGIHPASEICLRAESRALHRIGDGVFELQNGPFMRRFLDGFYPLRLSLRVDYPTSLTLADFLPQAQPGFEVTEGSDQLIVEATFEGQLRTSFRFLGD